MSKFNLKERIDKAKQEEESAFDTIPEFFLAGNESTPAELQEWLEDLKENLEFTT